MSIEIRGIRKAFDGTPVLKGVSLDIPDGELVALLGPSGCGKTTLLRIIAGLEHPDAGEVRHAGEDISARSARDRNVGVVFQHYALFRHLTVAENVGFALQVRRRPRGEIAARVDELLQLVQLDGFRGRYPHQLSGGQRQRVALARALATSPRTAAFVWASSAESGSSRSRTPGSLARARASATRWRSPPESLPGFAPASGAIRSRSSSSSTRRVPP